jgi:hypothetical protein
MMRTTQVLSLLLASASLLVQQAPAVEVLSAAQQNALELQQAEVMWQQAFLRLPQKASVEYSGQCCDDVMHFNMRVNGGGSASLMYASALQANPRTTFEQWARQHGRTYLDEPQVGCPAVVAVLCSDTSCVLQCSAQGHAFAEAAAALLHDEHGGLQEKEQRFRNWMDNLEHVLEHSQTPSTMRVRDHCCC